jgi:hypothetical protein
MPSTPDDGLAVEGERLRAQLGRSRRNRRITVGPVIAAAGEKLHGLAVSSHDLPVAVVLDLVDPVGAAGGLATRASGA